MNKGRVEQFGRPSDVYWRPGSRFVADFTGATNFIPARVLRQGGGEGALLICGMKVEVRANDELEVGEDVHAVIRPEWLQLSASRPSNGSGLSGRLIDIGFHGNVSTYEIELDGGIKLTARKTSEPTAQHPAPEFSVAQQVWVSWKPEGLRILPR
jgi:putrescine transport system ATP-binding protein